MVNMQLKQLAIILLVVLLSFIFKTAEIRRYDTQVVFLLLVLLTLVVNKLMNWTCNGVGGGRVEPYKDFAAEINNFLGRDLPADATQADVRKYNDHLTSLNDKIDTMNTYLGEIRQHQQRPAGGQPATAMDELNIQASQQIQDYRIRNMEAEIQRTTDLIKKAKMEQDSSKYKKIPVYSSCIVSNADGSVSMAPAGPGPRSASSVAAGSPSGGIVQDQQHDSTDMGMGAKATNSSQGANGQPVSSNSGGNMASGGVRELLQHVLNNGIDVNLST